MTSDPFQNGGALLDLRQEVAGVIVSGADAADYLQRMVSADLRKLTPESGCLSTLMTSKGRMLAGFEVYVRPEGFLLVVEASAGQVLAESLDRLVILEDVTVASAPGECVSLQGPRAAEILKLAFGVSSSAEERGVTELGDAGVAFRRARSQAGGYDVWTADGASTLAALEKAGGERVQASLAESHRIEAGIPRFGVDASDATMPPEAGYEDAVAYDKGCYAGQEVVARIRTYGHVNKILRRIRFSDEALPAVGEKVFVGEKEMGVITSSCISPTTGQGVALGYVRLKGGEPGTTVRVGEEELTGLVEER